MVGLSSTWMLVLGLPVLILHLASVALTKALQSYSRSRLEELSADRGHAGRADEVTHLDHLTERSSESLAVLTGLFLAALIGVALDQFGSPPRLELVLLPILVIGAVGYVITGVLGKVFAETILDVFWPATFLIRNAAIPFMRGSRALENLVEWLAGDSETEPRPASLEVEVPSEGEDSEIFDFEVPDAARVLLQNTVELTRTSVSEIMKPSATMVMLPSTVTARDAAREFRRTGYSRLPIFGENKDDIVGILLAKDLLLLLAESGQGDVVMPVKLMRQAYFVPETRNAFELLQDLRSSRTQMAIVLDELGFVSGLVTLEDLLEQLVGPIVDEHDLPPPPDPVRSLGGTRYEVDATMTLEELNNRFDLRLPTEADFQTVGGLAFHALGRLPEQGTSFRFDGIEFTILDIQDHSIRRVIIDFQPLSPAQGKF